MALDNTPGPLSSDEFPKRGRRKAAKFRKKDKCHVNVRCALRQKLTCKYRRADPVMRILVRDSPISAILAIFKIVVANLYIKKND